METSMEEQTKKSGKANGLKIFIASISITAMLGLYNFLQPNKDADTKNESDPDVDDLKNILNSPIPTIIPLAENSGQSQELTTRDADSIIAPTNDQETQPEIEIVVVGSGSTGGSSGSTTTSSSR